MANYQLSSTTQPTQTQGSYSLQAFQLGLCVFACPGCGSKRTFTHLVNKHSCHSADDRRKIEVMFPSGRTAHGLGTANLHAHFRLTVIQSPSNGSRTYYVPASSGIQGSPSLDLGRFHFRGLPRLSLGESYTWYRGVPAPPEHFANAAAGLRSGPYGRSGAGQPFARPAPPSTHASSPNSFVPRTPPPGYVHAQSGGAPSPAGPPMPLSRCSIEDFQRALLGYVRRN